MSGAAKYTIARLSPALLERLADQRRQEGAATRRRLNATVASLLAERLAALQADCRHLAATLQSRLNEGAPAAAGGPQPHEVVTLLAACEGAESLLELEPVHRRLAALVAAGQGPDHAEGRTALPEGSATQPPAPDGWEALRTRMTVEMADLEARLTAFKAEPIVAAWCQTTLQDADDLLAQATSAVSQGAFTHADGVMARLTRRLAAALAEAERRQQEEEARSLIVAGLVQVLQAQDFVVGAPDLSEPGNLDSEVVIRAMRPDRRRLAVRIPVSGRLTYAVDGYPSRTEPGPAGEPTHRCDEAEARLDAIHRQLATDCGIETDGLVWEGQDPRRRPPLGRHLPEVRPPGERTRGGA